MAGESWLTRWFSGKPPAFTLRPSQVADAPLFYHLINRTMREFIVGTWGQWDEARIQREALEDSQSPKAQVIEIGGNAVGIWVVDRTPHRIHLEQIYLLPAYQRRGIGTSLLKKLILEATQADCPLTLRVIVINPAKQFYDRLGFVVIETTPAFFLMEKQP
jgi:GNAT superfamily N-acetyltransferase